MHFSISVILSGSVRGISSLGLSPLCVAAAPRLSCRSGGEAREPLSGKSLVGIRFCDFS